MAINTPTQRPLTRTPEQLKAYMKQLEESGFKMELLDQYAESAQKRSELLQQLQKIDPTLKVDVAQMEDTDRLVEELALYRQEVAAKKKWSLWEYVKSVPRRIWGTMKRHPYITAAVVIGLGTAAAYYTGVGPVVVGKLKAWLMSTAFGQKMAGLGGKAMGAAEGAVGKGKELAEGAIGKGKDLIAQLPGVPDATPQAPVATPPAGPAPTPTPAPSVIPNLKDADAMIDGIGTQQ